jgi:hypothetical protein
MRQHTFVKWPYIVLMAMFVYGGSFIVGNTKAGENGLVDLQGVPRLTGTPGAFEPVLSKPTGLVIEVLGEYS